MLLFTVRKITGCNLLLALPLCKVYCNSHSNLINSKIPMHVVLLNLYSSSKYLKWSVEENNSEQQKLDINELIN